MWRSELQLRLVAMSLGMTHRRSDKWEFFMFLPFSFHNKNCESKNKDWDLTNTSAHPILPQFPSRAGAKWARKTTAAAGVPTERPLLGGCGSSTRTGCCRFRLREGVWLLWAAGPKWRLGHFKSVFIPFGNQTWLAGKSTIDDFQSVVGIKD